MNRDELFSKIRDVLVEGFELDASKITLETHLVDDLDLDSIDAIDMAVKLQEMVGRRFSETELRALRTVGDIVDLVEPRVAAS